MRARDATLLALLFALALGLRLYEVTSPPERWGDELVHVPAATHYWEKGHFDPNLWEHPPLRHLLLAGFLRVLGDGPLGWRLRNVLSGALAAVLVALLAYSVDGSRLAAAVAGLLMATDPLHVVLSRFTFEEVYGGAFFVAALVASARARRRPTWILASALLMGCALATKWYYVPAWLVVTGLALHEDGTWRRPADALFVVSAYAAVPVMVYALSFGPWFGRGYSVGELGELTVNAYYSLRHMGPETFNRALAYLHPTRAWEWFVSPVMLAQQLDEGSDTGRFLVFGNNLPVWALTLPAMLLCGAEALRRRSLPCALPVLYFGATYAVPLLARRPTLIYSAVPLLPFAFTAIGLSISRLAARAGPRAAWAVVALLLASNLYLYPLATGREVPLAPYRAVLTTMEFPEPTALPPR